MAPSESSAVPGDGLLHPLVLISVMVMVVNDHWLKGADLLPGVVTGKLSDVAGMVFFPLALQAVVEVVLHWMGRPWGPSRRQLLALALATGLFFGGIQVSDGVAWVWTHGLGALQWPVHALMALVRGDGLPAVVPVAHTADVTDLVAVPAVGLSVWVGGRRQVGD